MCGPTRNDNFWLKNSPNFYSFILSHYRSSKIRSQFAQLHYRLLWDHRIKSYRYSTHMSKFVIMRWCFFTSDLSYQAAQRVLAAADGEQLAALKEISQNFPVQTRSGSHSDTISLPLRHNLSLGFLCDYVFVFFLYIKDKTWMCWYML